MHLAFPLIRIAKGYSNGGIPRAVHSRCQMLTEIGHRVTVIASLDDVDEPPPCPNVRLVHVPLRRRAPQRVPALNDVLHGRAIARALAEVHRSDPIDIVDVQEPNLAFGLYPVATKLRMGKVNSIHQSVLDGNRRFSRARQAVFKSLNLYAAKGADLNIAVSEFAKDGLVSHGVPAERVVVVYNPIPMPESVPERIRVEGESTKLLWIGVNVPRKRIVTAVESASILADRGTNVSWTFIGDGPSRAGAEQQCKSDARVRAVFLGHVTSPDELNRSRFESDVFVATSEHEISPLVIGEAMAAGMAIVCSDITPHLELIGEAGLSYRLGDATDLADKVQELVESPDRRESLGRAARDRALEMFSWDRLRSGLESAYRSVRQTN